MQSIISTRTSSPNLAHLFRPSIYHAASHSLNLSPSLSPSRFRAKYLIRYLSLSLPISLLVSLYHFPAINFPPPSTGVHLCLLLIVVPDILRAVTVNSLKENSFSSAGGRPRHRSHPDPNCTSSSLRLTVWLVFFSPFQINHMLNSTETRPQCCPSCCWWQHIWTFL